MGKTLWTAPFITLAQSETIMFNATPYLPRSGSEAGTSSRVNTIPSSGQSSTSEDDSEKSQNPFIKLRIKGSKSYYYLSGAPTPDSRSKTDTETSSRVGTTSSSEQSSVSEDDSVKAEHEPVIKARKTRNTAPYDPMTSASPTVKNTQTEDQKRARYGQARNLPAYLRDNNIKKIKTTKQGGAAELPQPSKTDRRWDQFTKELTADGELALFSLGENDISEFVAWVRTSPVSLRELSLYNCEIDAANAKKLAEALRGNTTLTMLRLDGVIGFIDRAALADALKVNKTLTTLYLTLNRFSAEDVEALADALKVNKTLTTLDLSFNKINAKGAEALADALKVNKTLTKLRLAGNKIDAKGAEALADALEINQTLTKLDVSFSNFGAGGAVALLLVGAPGGNKTLTTLDLQDNQLGAEGAQALASALRINKTLTTLDLSDNDIGDVGAEALASRLRGNTTLTKLKIKDNAISDDGAVALVRALRGNTTLTTLDLCDNEFESDDVLSLHRALQDIPTLATLILKDDVIQPSSIPQFDLQASSSESDQS
jgi:Ran GTPase-activating protein (RanGAP) involved in mRNA processing and transport